MNRHWTLRDALYNLLHRWPSMLAALFIGSLLGLGLSLAWPAHYRADSRIYIALNPYRIYSDTIFEALANPKYSNLDNYHYWQMSQLSAAIYLDRFVQPALERLRALDPYWNSVSLDEFRRMLDAEWRSTGNWDLIANHPSKPRARQAATAWSDVVVEQVRQAVDSARQTFMVDQELQAVKDARLQASLRIQDLQATQAALNEWRDGIKTPTDAPLDMQQRWRLLALVSSPAHFTPAWTSLLDAQPPSEAPLSAYLEWIDSAGPVLEAEIAALERQVDQLSAQQDELTRQFTAASQDSLGFSPNIEVQRKQDLDVRQIRPSSTFILVGGLIGVLAWLLFQLMVISRLWRDS